MPSVSIARIATGALLARGAETRASAAPTRSSANLRSVISRTVPTARIATPSASRATCHDSSTNPICPWSGRCDVRRRWCPAPLSDAAAARARRPGGRRDAPSPGTARKSAERSRGWCRRYDVFRATTPAPWSPIGAAAPELRHRLCCDQSARAPPRVLPQRLAAWLDSARGPVAARLRSVTSRITASTLPSGMVVAVTSQVNCEPSRRWNCHSR